MSELFDNNVWGETSYYGAPGQKPETIQAQHDQLLMQWQAACQVAGEHDETIELCAQEFANFLHEHPELYPEMDQN